MFSHIDRDPIIRSKAGRYYSHAALGLREIDMGGNRQGPLQRNVLGLSPPSRTRIIDDWTPSLIGSDQRGDRPHTWTIIFGQSINDLDALALHGPHSSESQPQHQRPVPGLVARAFL